jgi:hypothetical protein
MSCQYQPHPMNQKIIKKALEYLTHLNDDSEDVWTAGHIEGVADGQSLMVDMATEIEVLKKGRKKLNEEIAFAHTQVGKLLREALPPGWEELADGDVEGCYDQRDGQEYCEAAAEEAGDYAYECFCPDCGMILEKPDGIVDDDDFEEWFTETHPSKIVQQCENCRD